MPNAPCKFIKRIAEFQDRKQSDKIPNNTRGIYVLLHQAKDNKEQYDVVYVGMSGRSDVSGMWARLNHHNKSKYKKWTHFTIFEVHDNITNAEIKELEALMLFSYRKDSRVNKHNVQRRYKPFRQILEKKLPWAKCE